MRLNQKRKDQAIIISIKFKRTVLNIGIVIILLQDCYPQIDQKALI